MSTPVVVQHPKRGRQVELVEGAPWIHFHHQTDDRSANLGRPCVVEMTCHVCRKSELVRFRFSLVTMTPTVWREKDVERVRERFCLAHRNCSPQAGEDWSKACSRMRDGDPVVHDFAND